MDSLLGWQNTLPVAAIAVVGSAVTRGGGVLLLEVTSYNDERHGHDRVHLLDGCDDHDAALDVGAATLLVTYVHVARVCAAAAIG